MFYGCLPQRLLLSVYKENSGRVKLSEAGSLFGDFTLFIYFATPSNSVGAAARFHGALAWSLSFPTRRGDSSHREKEARKHRRWFKFVFAVLPMPWEPITCASALSLLCQ